MKKILLKDMLYVLSRDSDLYYKSEYVSSINSAYAIDWLAYEVYHIESEDGTVCVYLRDNE